MNTVVLFSGGLDSAVLVAHEAQHATVQPVYVSVRLGFGTLRVGHHLDSCLYQR